jgi:undecaprenyl-diphosphatase
MGRSVTLKQVAAVWLLLLACFVALALRAHRREVLGLDVTLARWVQSLPSVAGDVFSLPNWLGAGPELSIVTIAAAAGFIYRRDLQAAALMLLTYVPRTFNDLMKMLVDEPRPDSNLVRVNFPHDNLSFPSGHVVGLSMAFALLFVLAPRLSDSRFVVLAIRAACFFFVGTAGLARVWLGAHWPTDTLGAYIYAALFLIPAVVWATRHPAPAVPSEPERVELRA